MTETGRLITIVAAAVVAAADDSVCKGENLHGFVLFFKYYNMHYIS